MTWPRGLGYLLWVPGVPPRGQLPALDLVPTCFRESGDTSHSNGLPKHKQDLVCPLILSERFPDDTLFFVFEEDFQAWPDGSTPQDAAVGGEAPEAPAAKMSRGGEPSAPPRDRGSQQQLRPSGGRAGRADRTVAWRDDLCGGPRADLFACSSTWCWALFVAGLSAEMENNEGRRDEPIDVVRVAGHRFEQNCSPEHFDLLLGRVLGAEPH